MPGLERELEDDAWTLRGPSHPQYGMGRLLARLGVERGGVPDWDLPGVAPSLPHRARLAAAALRPPASGPSPKPVHDRALDGVTRIDCPTPHEEAGVIALILRQALQDGDQGRTAALMTPDRALARRVAAELGRFGIAVDDSAGRPLDQTPPGVFLRLLTRAAAEEFAPLPLLALLKHPLASGGRAPGDFRARVRALELAALRGPRPAPGLEGLRRAAEGDARAGEVVDASYSRAQISPISRAGPRSPSRTSPARTSRRPRRLPPAKATGPAPCGCGRARRARRRPISPPS